MKFSILPAKSAHLMLAAAALAAVAPSRAQTSVDKVHQFTQNGVGTVVPDPVAPFVANVFSVNPASVTEPNGQGLSLTYSAADMDYENNQSFSTQAALDAAFPDGVYNFTLTGQAAQQMNLTGDLYPPAPAITNTAWNSSNQLVVDPSAATNLTFSSFPQYGTVARATEVYLQIANADSSIAFTMTWLSDTYPTDPTSVTIPALTLSPGIVYTAEIVFGTFPELSSSGGAAYLTGTSFSILAQASGGATPPGVAIEPLNATVAQGSTASFTFAASGSPGYQWYFNGSAIAGATDSILIIRNAGSANVGAYTCVASNSSGSVTSTSASLAVIGTSEPGRLINISCRAQVGIGPNILIAGFAVGGAGTAGSESLLLRGSGPALVPFGIADDLPDPQLQLFSGPNVLATNNGWGGVSAIVSSARSVGAFAWSDPSSHDSALLESLGGGAYTAQVQGQSTDTGVGLVEVYDATPADAYTASSPRIINLSARVQVGLGSNILIAGFVIGGSTSRTVLIRGSGPALAPLGVAGTLPDPKLQLFSGTQSLATNQGWNGDPVISAVASGVGAFPWTDAGSGDSAIIATLPPGSYTAQISGASNDTGVALVEVYEVP